MRKVIAIASQGAVIAHVNCGFGEGERNANLIAAAPDLAACIQAHLALIDSREVITAERVNEVTTAMRAALAKAGL